MRIFKTARWPLSARRLGKRLVLASLAAACTSACLADDDIGGSVRAQWSGLGVNGLGPLAQANVVQPGWVLPPTDGVVLSTELKGQWKSIASTVTLQQQRKTDQATDSNGFINELFAAVDAGAWQYSAGKKIVGWDVGFGFRPNDFVQQEERRPLVSTTPVGRPLLMAEHFTADASWSLVWVNPTAQSEKRNGQEPAWAARYYQRDGAFDWHGFARLGAHTGASLGAAAVWVANESVELHGSLRVLQRYDGLQPTSQNANLLSADPWQPQTQGEATQALIGGTWTSEDQSSVYVEAWWDGTALSNAQWDAWNARSGSLAALAGRGVPAAAIAGNLAWQANAFGASASLRRTNLFVRWTKSFGAWTPAVDTLYTPEDGGRMLSGSLAWQGDRVSVSAALRVYGGPSEAVLAQLPTRQTLVLNAAWAF